MARPAGRAQSPRRLDGGGVKLEQGAALVTGGGIRLGKAIALALGQAGLSVAVHYAHSSGGAEETVAELRRRGRDAEAFPADLTRPMEAEKLVDSVLKRMGRIDVLVNSAAVMLRTPPGSVSYESWS